MKSIGLGLLNFIRQTVSYLVSSSLIILLLMTVLSGKFPPPVFEFYQQLKSFQTSMAQSAIPANHSFTSAEKIMADSTAEGNFGTSTNPELSLLKAENEQLRTELHRTQNELNDLKDLRRR